MSRRYALNASASFFDRVVEETFARQGTPVQLGGTDALAVPLPPGVPYLARARWLARDRVEVTEPNGARHEIGPDQVVRIERPPIALELRVVARPGLRRTEDVSWRMSAAWLAVVLASSVMVMQLDLLYDYSCETLVAVDRGLPRLAPAVRAMMDERSLARCLGGEAAGGVSPYYTTEYIARLLREDYAGEDGGAMEPSDPQDGQSSDKPEHYYMPAGDDGPKDLAGGAAETAPEPTRGEGELEDEDAVAEEIALEPQRLEVEAAPVGAPVPSASEEQVTEVEPPQPSGDDAVVEADDPTTEQDEGFGLEDWYDAPTAQLEELEIDLMMRHAKNRLRINPNDIDALGLLSYYQYLGEDYESALRTYDKIIALSPEDSAGYNNKALVYKRLGDYEREEALYRVALALRPTDDVALNNLAVALSHQGRFAEGLEIMKQLEVLTPDDPYADLHRAKIHAEMGDLDTALIYVEKALDRMARLDTLHHIEFRQDIRLDPSLASLRRDPRFQALLVRYYGKDSPLRP